MNKSRNIPPIPRSRALQTVPVGAEHALAYANPAQQDAGGFAAQITPGFVWWVFQEWWKFVVPAGAVLAFLTGWAVIYFHVPMYEANAQLVIEDRSPYIAFSQAAASESSRYVETQQQIIRSSVILEPVLSQPRIASIPELVGSVDRVETLRKNLWVKPQGRSEIYDISYTSASAVDAAAIVNAVADQYMVYHEDDDARRTQHVVDLLEDERRRRMIEVERLRRRVVALAEEATGKDPFSGSLSDAKKAVNPIGSIVQNLTDLDLEREMLKAQRVFIEETANGAHDPLATSTLLKLEIENHPEIEKREEDLRAIRTQLEEIKNDAIRAQRNPHWEDNRAYVALTRELEHRQKDLDEFKPTLKKMILARRDEERKATGEQELKKIDNRLALLETQYSVLEKSFDDQLGKIKTGEGKSVELEFARSELEREEKVFEMIASRKLALQTEMRAPARIQLQRRADVPMMAKDPMPYRVLMLACSVAICVPFGMALLKELLVRRVSDVEQLARETRLRILGEIAELPVRNVAVSARRMSGRLQRSAHVFAESINSLRTNLSVAEDLHDMRVFALLSAVSGESKSSVATSLAMSFANSTGRPTLVIDGDMRSPDVAAMLKTKSQPGLFEVLSGKSELEDCIQHVADSQLYVLPAGRADRTAHHYVTVKATEALMQRLRSKFQTILIDTPPVLGASESVVLAKAADAGLFCSLAGVSKITQVQMAVDRLEHAGVNVAGAVLSGSSVRRYAYRYGYYPVEASQQSNSATG
jgi:capsular exopolysaccharide synthesis family protein